jgi:hypothetical protein
MRAHRSVLLLVIFSLFFCSSCKRKTEELNTEKISEYLPLQVGKYITYRLDSLVYLQAGRAEETHYFEEKHVVDAMLADNLGRPAYRVYRFTRDTLGTGPWTSAGSYFVTPLEQSLEFIENNLRSIRLTLPIIQDHSWKGNRFMPDDPYTTLFGSEFGNDDFIEDWDYTYEGIGESIVLKGQAINDVLTVKGVDEAVNVPITPGVDYAYINYSVDKYAKGIGLVYQEMIMWEYQAIPGGPTPFKRGFGIRRVMIDHN